MATVTLQQLQQDPAAYFRRVEAGETLLVMRDERPVAEIKPVISPNRGLRRFGLCRGQFTVPDDFDAPLPQEILDEFETVRFYHAGDGVCAVVSFTD